MEFHYGFTGTRIGMTDAQKDCLANLVAMQPDDPGVCEYHHGDCVGSDEQFHEIVRSILPRARIVGHPPTEPRHRAFCKFDYEFAPAPYLERNKIIVDCSSSVIATPAQEHMLQRSGTWATVRYTIKKGVWCTIIWPSGLVSYTWMKDWQTERRGIT